MCNPKFRLDDKVIPISKSIGVAFIHDNQWARAKKENQPFLYVTKIVSLADQTFFYQLSFLKDRISGNHYGEQDLLPFFDTNRNAIRFLNKD